MKTETLLICNNCGLESEIEPVIKRCYCAKGSFVKSKLPGKCKSQFRLNHRWVKDAGGDTYCLHCNMTKIEATQARAAAMPNVES
jgi:hypothetical protein